MGMPDVDPAPRISALSKHVGLPPEHAITRLDFAARSEGNGHVDEATVSAETLDELDRDLERWWDSIERLGQDASDLLTKSNLRLVVSVARRYLRRGLPLLDLIQEGNLGLVDSAGGDPCPGRSGPHHPATRPRGRAAPAAQRG